MSILRVALDLPLPQLFDYTHDEASSADIGMRVLVPFGQRQTVGVIVGLAATSEISGEKLKSALRVLRETPALGGDWLDLAQFCSDYYHRPLGEVIFNGLPAGLRRPAAAPAVKQAAAYRLSALGHESLAQSPARKGIKRALLQALAQSDCAEELLLAQSPSAKAVLAKLRSSGWIERYPLAPTPSTRRFVDSLDLNAEQRHALEAIERAGPGYGVFLLHGVTGSGKTEIYLRLIARAVAAGNQALVLVPEINLTPRLTQEFCARFPDTPLVTLHSGLGEGVRTQHWLRAQSGAAAIVLGTRLAAFAPCRSLR